MKTKTYKPINLKLSHAQFAAVTHLAEREGVTRASLIRDLIAEKTEVPDTLQRHCRSGDRAKRRRK